MEKPYSNPTSAPPPYTIREVPPSIYRKPTLVGKQQQQQEKQIGFWRRYKIMSFFFYWIHRQQASEPTTTMAITRWEKTLEVIGLLGFSITALEALVSLIQYVHKH